MTNEKRKSTDCRGTRRKKGRKRISFFKRKRRKEKEKRRRKRKDSREKRRKE
jgi:hypothetical protein